MDLRDTEREERRSWPRVAYFEDVIAYADQRRLRCRSLDLGAGGMALRAPFDDPPPPELRLNLRLDSGQTVVVDASVVECSRAADAGPVWNLCFEHIPRAIQGRIATYVAERATTSPVDRRPTGPHTPLRSTPRSTLDSDDPRRDRDR